MNRNHAIALLDSGIGGLTVVREINKQLPQERIVYFGDTARMPYGPRPQAEVRGFASQIIRFLLTQDVKLVIVACNTATAAGLPAYQQAYDLPIIGVIEPGVRAALHQTRTKRIGVIGTPGTIASKAYEDSLRTHDATVEIFSQACPLFVLLVENDLVNTPAAVCVAEEYLRPLREAGVDTLILGCTHYPLMAEVIGKVMGPEVTLISSAAETAQEAKAILSQQQSLRDDLAEPLRHRFFVSGNPKPFTQLAETLLAYQLETYQVLLT
ncbi:MAG TPA: glutamate racemase [Oscillospiraceae bacterium]|nr:glutamate racemase [Oscillospiraceae bacterium]